MTPTRDTSIQTDVNKYKTEPDKRPALIFRSTIEKGGKFEPEAGRYHLYVSYACPWATRALIVRKLKGLEEIIPATIVSPRMGENGWPFSSMDNYPGAEIDPLYNAGYVKELYLKADPEYTGRFSVPVLWDTKNHTIVNNESSEIIRIFNTAFNHLIPADKVALDIYPAAHRAEIDAVNEWVYDTINNGVYKAGHARSQETYQEAVVALFDSLDKLEILLTDKDYLIGNILTEADIRLWVTLIRFDPVYVGHFKCNIRTIRHGYPALNKWMKKLYWNNDNFKSSTNFDHIKTRYYWSHTMINPFGIVPFGPVPDIESL